MSAVVITTVLTAVPPSAFAANATAFIATAPSGSYDPSFRPMLSLPPPEVALADVDSASSDVQASVQSEVFSDFEGMSYESFQPEPVSYGPPVPVANSRLRDFVGLSECITRLERVNTCAASGIREEKDDDFGHDVYCPECNVKCTSSTIAIPLLRQNGQCKCCLLDILCGSDYVSSNGFLGLPKSFQARIKESSDKLFDFGVDPITAEAAACTLVSVTDGICKCAVDGIEMCRGYYCPNLNREFNPETLEWTIKSAVQDAIESEATANESSVQAPAANESSVQAPAANESSVQAPAANESSVQAPAANESSVQAPAESEATANESSVQVPAEPVATEVHRYNLPLGAPDLHEYQLSDEPEPVPADALCSCKEKMMHVRHVTTGAKHCRSALCKRSLVHMHAHKENNTFFVKGFKDLSSRYKNNIKHLRDRLQSARSTFDIRNTVFELLKYGKCKCNVDLDAIKTIDYHFCAWCTCPAASRAILTGTKPKSKDYKPTKFYNNC